MVDKREDGVLDLSSADGIELTDEELDSIAGGFIYHDEGDPLAHRKEAFYVLDAKGKIIMKVDDMSKAKHWAGNLRTSLQTLSTEEFEKLRRL